MCSPAALLRAGSALVQDRSRGRMASARSGTAVAVAVTFLRLCARITSDCEGRRSWPLDPPARGGPGALLAVEHHQFGPCPQRRPGVAPHARRRVLHRALGRSRPPPALLRGVGRGRARAAHEGHRLHRRRVARVLRALTASRPHITAAAAPTASDRGLRAGGRGPVGYELSARPLVEDALPASPRPRLRRSLRARGGRAAEPLRLLRRARLRRTPRRELTRP